MKKLYVALALALTTNYSLAAAEKKVNKPKLSGRKPAVVLQVLDISANPARLIDGNKLSISKKQNRLCWVSINVPMRAKVTVTETFYSPNKLTVVSKESKKQVASTDNKSHDIVTEIDNKNKTHISRCWDFNKTDPIGKYKMDVKIDGYIFKGLEFEIVK